MTAQSRDYLKGRFEHLDQPTAQDFADLIDSFLLVTAQFWFDDQDSTMWIDAVTGDPWTE